MAAISRSRRSAAGIAFIVGGALLLLNIVLGYAGAATAAGYWPTVLAYLAVAVGFAILAIGSVTNVAARIALIVAAVGWFLLAVSPLVGLPGPVGVIALLAAAAGGIVGSVVLYAGKEITDRSAVALIITTIVSGLLLLAPLIGLLDVTLFLILTIAFAVGLVITGVFFHRVQRGR